MPEFVSQSMPATHDVVATSGMMLDQIVRMLVAYPDHVTLSQTALPGRTLFVLTVDPRDLWNVVGKHGRTAQSLRAILHSVGQKANQSFELEIELGRSVAQ